MNEVSSPGPEDSKPRGSLAPKADEAEQRPDEQESQLQGSLLRGDKAERETDELPTSLIQRDSGDIYEVIQQTDTRYGVVVKLKAPDGHAVTLNRDSLVATLNEEGAPWRQPEN